MKRKPAPLLVAIVGGSGAGKSWLADQLQSILGTKSARISLDDFYRDRPGLSPARRARINFDHPRAIDWPLVERVLRDCLAWRMTRVPQYDFKTHARLPHSHIFRPKPLILVEGLWLSRNPRLRRLFGASIYIDCPAKVRLIRRQARDSSLRGRSVESIRRCFRETVEPMNARFVTPQARRADILLKTPITGADVRRVGAQLLGGIEKASGGSKKRLKGLNQGFRQ
jgi:uridine kinase